MSLARKLDAWTAAGLIDAGAAERILSYEGANDRPYALWAILGLGLFALALGIMLIVAANWDQIAQWLKLAVHMALTFAAAAAVWVAAAPRRAWLREGALFVLGALVLAGIALHSQTYQLTGPIWQALLFWLVVMTPLLFYAGRTRLIGYAWSLILLWMLVDLVLGTEARRGVWLLLHGLAVAGPAFLILVSLLPRPGGRVAAALREVGIAALLGAASLAHFAWAESISRSDAAAMLVRFVPAAIVAAAAMWAGWRWRCIPQALLPTLLVFPTLAAALALAVPHPDGIVPRLVGALVFGGMWALVARTAAASGWRMLFGIAIAAIGIRIFIIYFELFGTLATTGAGLIAGGLLVIALALGWRRVFRLARP